MKGNGGIKAIEDAPAADLRSGLKGFFLVDDEGFRQPHPRRTARPVPTPPTLANYLSKAQWDVLARLGEAEEERRGRCRTRGQ